MKIWLAATNNYKNGRRDEYHLLKQVPVSSQKAVIDLKNHPSLFYKIVLQGPYNTVNRWILTGKEKN